jgi:enoyl-CoA hydratase/carnithine racemase
MSEHIVSEQRDGIAILRMQRPEKKNAITLAMYQALSEGLTRADADAEVRAAVILGTPEVFSAGNDIGDFVKAASTGGDMTPPIRFLHTLAGFAKPVVAGVSGVAIGIGTTMLLHCDLVYASASARFKTPFVDLGLTPEGGSSLLLPHLLGQRGAAQWLLLGDELDGEGARQAGIVNEVVADAEQAALGAAARLAKKPPSALAAAKQLMKRGMAAAITETIDHEAKIFAERLRSPEALAALMSFRNKK